MILVIDIIFLFLISNYFYKCNFTDSAIYIERESEEPKVELSGFLGCLTNELIDYGKNAYIKSFCSGGPKNYSYEIINPDTDEISTVTKVKGLSLNYENSKKINFNSMLSLIKNGVAELDNDMCVSNRSFVRQREGGVSVKRNIKVYRAVIQKRRIVGTRTFPFGYDISNNNV